MKCVIKAFFIGAFALTGAIDLLSFGQTKIAHAQQGKKVTVQANTTCEKNGVTKTNLAAFH